MSNYPINNNTPIDFQPEEENEGGLGLGALLGTCLKHKWPIIGLTVLGCALGLAKAMTTTPIYGANALLQVQDKRSTLPSLDPQANNPELKSPITSKIELFKSRKIIGGTVAALNLEIHAAPVYFPVIGSAFARHFSNSAEDQELSPPLFNLSEYAWGGEKIQISTLTVPESWLDSNLTLVAGEKGHYRLLRQEELILEGEVGHQAVKELSNNHGTVTILVAALNARPDTRFNITRLSQGKAIKSLLTDFTISERGKGSDFLELSMESPSPELAMRTLNEMISIYLQQNVGHKSAELQKTSDFLENQLSTLKAQIDAASAELDAYKAKQGTVDLDAETKSLLNVTVDLQAQISDLQEKHDELRLKFTESHPSVTAINTHIARLKAQIAANNSKIETLPETQQAIVKLSRDVKVNTEFYNSLLNNSLATKVAKEGTVGDSRVIDYAVLNNIPIKPNTLNIVAIGSVLGFGLGVLFSLMRERLNRGIDNPNLIEKHLNLQVIASVPFTENQSLINKLIKSTKNKIDQPQILAVDNHDDLAVESLRNLRTNLHFTFVDSKNNIITITGPSPDIGKSFVSLNLTALLAQSGKKVLLIDADMRKGIINKSLALKRGHGLSELITNQITLDQAINHITVGNFDFISTGVLPPNPSELLLHPRFAALLETLNAQYDHIIIDTPPILAVTDAAIIGRMTAATLMVVKSGQHPMRELEQSVKRLLQARVLLKGIVFNGYQRTISTYDYGYTNYVYKYNDK